MRMMPDVHPGQTGAIGLTMTVGGRITVGESIIPQLPGIDIGCGITCIRIREKRMEFVLQGKIINPADLIRRAFLFKKSFQFHFR